MSRIISLSIFFCAVLSNVVIGDDNSTLVHAPSKQYTVAFNSRASVRYANRGTVFVQFSEGKKLLWRREVSLSANTDRRWRILHAVVSNEGTTAFMTQSGGIWITNKFGKDQFYDDDFLASRRSAINKQLSHPRYWDPTDVVFFKRNSSVFVYRGWPFGRVDVDLMTGAQKEGLLDIDERRVIRGSIDSTETISNMPGLFWSGVLDLKENANQVKEIGFERARLFSKRLECKAPNDSVLEIDKIASQRFLLNATSRRLGIGPSIANVMPVRLQVEGVFQIKHEAKTFEERRSATSKLKAGMTRTSVFDLLGSPDYVSLDDWFYEIFPGKENSLFIDFKGERVFAVQQMEPVVDSNWLTEAVFFNDPFIGRNISPESVENSFPGEASPESH
ncbi:MAG: hypothetical protein WBD31_16800 [Rubripirellula sp.]